MMHRFIVFPFFLKYLINAEYMISSWPVASTAYRISRHYYWHKWRRKI